ncbi:MAG: putative DNA binding domain-containing protein [Phycisphaeraceae bacterium]|nr:putative DNA binding domain-containing protein [Phycisphaeraceae bacterium]
MTVTPAQIDLWRKATSESPNLEFKEGKNSFDIDKLYDYCIALANEGGGYFVLGVADKPPRPVVGSAAFPNTVAIAEKIFTKVGFHVEVEAVEHPDGRVVVFTIPPRPRGTAYHIDGRYLMRSGASLVAMSEDRLRSIFDEGKPDWLEEPSKLGMTGQEVVDALDTQTFFELLKLPFPSNQEAILDKLIAERLIERRSDGFAVRRLSAITIARRISDFPDVARKAPRVIVYEGNSKLKTKLDQTGTGGYAVRFKDLIRFIMGQLPQNEVVEDAIRRSVKLVPEEAVRELVANALIHQDFTIGGTSVMFEVYADRVEFSNPGLPVVPADRFIDGYQSRNERLADLMRRVGICEEKGSGIDRVVSLAEAYQLPAPEFRTGHQRTSVVVFGPRDFEDMDRNDRIRACYQHAALKRVMGEYMTNQSLRERFKLDESKSANVSQVITATVEAGLVKPDERVGSSRKLARYLPFWA